MGPSDLSDRGLGPEPGGGHPEAVHTFHHELFTSMLMFTLVHSRLPCPLPSVIITDDVTTPVVTQCLPTSM